MKLATACLACIALCSAARAATVDPNKANALFEDAMAKVRDGQFAVAVVEYRQLLREVPTPRIKLELARALYLAGKYRNSLSLFKEIYLNSRTPQIVRRNILPFMEGAEVRLLRVRYGISVVTDSNPSQVAEGGTIFFNGYPYEYQPPAPKKPAYGIQPWVSVEKLWNNGFLTKFYGSARLFKNSALDAGNLQASIAKQIPAVPGLFVQASIAVQAKKDDSYYLPSIEAWKRFRLSRATSVGMGDEIGYMFAENNDISGMYYRPYAFGSWALMPNATVFSRISVEYLNSRNNYYTYYAPKITVGMDFRVKHFELTPELTVTRTAFTQYDSFWGLTRRDTTIRPEITISNDLLEWDGIRPELSFFYERRNSNVDIYDYNQIGGYINLRKLF
jgi:hypothetical protein